MLSGLSPINIVLDLRAWDPHPRESVACSFIDRAQRESVDTILEMSKLKTEGSARKLVVAGCLVERYRDEIPKNIPEVDAVVGTGELENILAAAGLTPASAGNSNSPGPATTDFRPPNRPTLLSNERCFAVVCPERLKRVYVYRGAGGRHLAS